MSNIDYGEAFFPGGIDRFSELIKPQVVQVELGKVAVTLTKTGELPSGLLPDEDEELMCRIFEPSKRVVRVGSAIPSEAMLAQYFAEIDAMQATYLIRPEDDKLIAT